MVRRRWFTSPRRRPPAGRAGLLVALAAGCFFGLDWLGPRWATSVQAAEETAAESPASGLDGRMIFDAACIPSDASVVIVMRPAELAQSPIARPVADALDQMLEPANLGLKVSELEEFKVVLAGGFQQPGNDTICAYMILRSRQAHDWKKVFQALLGASKEEELDGQKYFTAGDDSGGFSSFWCPDERTVVVGIARTFSTPDPNDRARWADLWQEAAKSPVAVMLDMNLFGVFADTAITEDPAQRLENELSALPKDGDFAIAKGDITADGFSISAQIACRSDAGAQRVANALAKGLTELAGHIAPPSAIDGDSEAHRLAEQMGRLADSTRIAAHDSAVLVQSEMSAEMLSTFAASAQSAARAQSQRQASQKKVAQIAAAMNTYHDAQGHFPPAVVMGPDGKTPHSWRVEILPYLEGGADLYARYRMNEPWDSDQNQQVMRDGVDLFMAPSEVPSDEPTHCGYFVVVGKGTLFDGDAKPTRQSVTDPADSTIMLVEARRSISWTKPEDIEFDPDAALPQLGGNLRSVFSAAFVDGSVRLLANNMDEATLRAMFTKAAGDMPSAEETAE